MTETKKATVREENGHQVIVLPDDIRLDSDEVYITHDVEAGRVTLSARPPHPRWTAMFAYMDSLEIPQEDLDAYMSERPLNRPASLRGIFDDES